MARQKRLTAKAVENAQHDGRTRSAQRHYDGAGSGLALNIQPGGSKSWVQGITIHGTRRWLGLGPYPLVTLKRAREKALENKRIAYEGGDPIAERDGTRRIPNFQSLAQRVIDMHAAEHKNPRSKAQWESSLATYAYPLIGRKRVDSITVADVMKCVEPIWQEKRETASRVRQRIASILDAAIAYGHRTDNPAKAALQLLPKRRAPVKHHRSLPYAAVPATIARIRESGAWLSTRLAFEYLVLTGARSGEVRLATWEEIDIAEKTWTVPSTRMKTSRPHRVPLAPRCLELLDEARQLTQGPMATRQLAGCNLLFPSLSGRPLSDSTLSKLVRENGIKAVPHGFRSSLRDFLSEQTDAPRAVMEMCLAHSTASEVERAYARSDLFDKRRALMDRWAEFAAGEALPSGTPAIREMGSGLAPRSIHLNQTT